MDASQWELEKRSQTFGITLRLVKNCQRKQILSVLDQYSLFDIYVGVLVWDKFGKELPKGCFPKGMFS